MTQKADRLPSAIDRLLQNQIAIDDLYGLNRLRTIPRSVSAATSGSGAAGGEKVVGSINALLTAGGTMIGPLALNPAILAIDDGRLDISKAGNPSTDASYVLVTGQGTPDDLEFIDGAQYNGQLVIIQGTNQTVINLLSAFLTGASSIVGDGSTNTITVTVSSTTGLLDGDEVNIIGTDNFDINGATISNVTSTTFEYDLGSIGSTTAEAGNVQKGNILSFDGGDITLDGTLNTLGVPYAQLIFDVTAIGGAWRIMNTSLASAGGDASQWSTFPALQDVDLADFDLLGVKNIDMDDDDSAILGLQNIDYFQADQTLTSTGDGLTHTVGDLQAHAFVINNGTSDFTALEIVDVGGDVLRLDMFDHTIENIKDLRFDATATNALPGASPGISYDDDTGTPTLSKLIINYPIVSSVGVAITQAGVTGSTFLESGKVESDLVTVNNSLLIGVGLSSEPTAVGQFTTFGNDVFVFSGGSSRNMSDISSAGANTALSNLASVSVNANIIPQSGLLLGSSGNEWSRVHTNKISLGTAGTFASSDNAIIADTDEGMEFHTPAADAMRFFFGTETSPAWTFSNGTLLGTNTASNIQLEGALLLNDTFDNNTDPTVEGQFKTVTPDVKVFSGGAVRNLSNIGVAAGGADVNLSNLSSTSVNANITPQAGLLLGSSTIPWSSVFANNLKFGTAGVVDTSISQIYGLSDDLRYDVATDGVHRFDVNDVTKTTINVNGLEVVGLLDCDNLQIDSGGSTPAIVGRFNNDGTDVNVFSGGLVRNMSEIGVSQDHSLWETGDTIDPDGEGVGTFDFYHTNSKNGGNGTSIPLPSSTAFFVPIYIAKSQTLRAIGLDVTVATATNVSVAIYDNRDDQNYPNERLEVETSGFADALGMQVNPAFFQALSPGLYWLAVVSAAGFSIRQFSFNQATNAGYRAETGETSKPITGYFETSTSTLPSTAALDMDFIDEATDLGVPAVFARFYL